MDEFQLHLYTLIEEFADTKRKFYTATTERDEDCWREELFKQKDKLIDFICKNVAQK